MLCLRLRFERQFFKSFRFKRLVALSLKNVSTRSPFFMILDNPKHRKFYIYYSPHSDSVSGRRQRGALRAHLRRSLRRTHVIPSDSEESRSESKKLRRDPSLPLGMTGWGFTSAFNFLYRSTRPERAGIWKGRPPLRLAGRSAGPALLVKTRASRIRDRSLQGEPARCLSWAWLESERDY